MKQLPTKITQNMLTNEMKVNKVFGGSNTKRSPMPSKMPKKVTNKLKKGKLTSNHS